MFTITSGNPTVEQARAIERAFAKLEAESRAAAANDRMGGLDGWTMSGRLASHGAAGGLASLRSS